MNVIPTETCSTVAQIHRFTAAAAIATTWSCDRIERVIPFLLLWGFTKETARGVEIVDLLIYAVH